MSDNQKVTDTTKSKWQWKRKCACGNCMFYSWEERPECPAMLADPTLVGEKLWYMDESMLGIKDYYDPMDIVRPGSVVVNTAANDEKVDKEEEE